MFYGILFLIFSIIFVVSAIIVAAFSTTHRTRNILFDVLGCIALCVAFILLFNYNCSEVATINFKLISKDANGYVNMTGGRTAQGYVCYINEDNKIKTLDRSYINEAYLIDGNEAVLQRITEKWLCFSRYKYILYVPK